MCIISNWGMVSNFVGAPYFGGKKVPLLNINHAVDFLKLHTVSLHVFFKPYENILLMGFLFLLLFIGAANYSRRRKAEREYESAQMELRSNLMELEAVNKQLIASEEELSRQFREIQDQKNKLRTSRERYRLAAAGAEFGIWDYDLRNGRIYMSKKGMEIVGFREHDQPLNMSNVMERIVAHDKPKVKALFERHIKRETDIFETQCRIYDQDGEYAWISMRGKCLNDESGEPIRMAGSVTNINKEKLNEAKIHKMAFYDTLTELPNRTYFNQIMEAFISSETIETFIVLFIDIDNFRAVNDTLGHAVGDQVLKQVGQMLNNQLGRGSKLVRFGGDEFVILIPNASSQKDIDHQVLRFMDAFRNSIEVEGIAYAITFSIGVAVYPQDGNNRDELLSHADLALNECKTNGKNGYMRYSRGIKEALKSRMKMENDLKIALEKDEFELYYQPKYDLEIKKIIGYEALIRWNHPTEGIVPPLDFIPLAEEIGLIVEIGEWVIFDAARQLKQWHDAGYRDLSVAVNLSARQLKDAKLVDMFKKLAKEDGIDLSKLEVEITESTALSDIGYAINILRNLRELGIKVSLDDFGTGYSSLNYLTVLPIDFLKIDKSFVQNASPQDSSGVIIKAVIALAHACNLKVVAEGVETDEQFVHLLEEGCDLIQGYFISRPLRAEQAFSLKRDGLGCQDKSLQSL